MTTDNMTTENKIELLHTGINVIAGQCNGAVTRDDVGFDGADTRFGKILAGSDPICWSAKMANIAIKMLAKYHGQLSNSVNALLKTIKPFPESKGSLILAERRAIKEELGVDTSLEATGLPADVDDLPLEWGKVKNVNTKRGLRGLRKAVSTEAMRKLWREHKAELQDMGLSLGQGLNGAWVFCHWGAPVEDAAVRFERKSQIELPPLQNLPVSVVSKLHKHQVVGTQRLVRGLDHWGAVLDGSDTGVGKTYKAMAAVIAMGGTPVVVCPLAIIPGWHKAGRHFGTKVIAINYESIRTGKSELGNMHRKEEELPNGKIKVTYTFEWTLDHIKNPVVIFDEVHKCKNPKSQSAALLAGADAQDLKVLMLSATAAVSPLDMRVVGSALHLFPKDSAGFWTWARKHGVASNGYGMQWMGSDEDLASIQQQIYGAGRGDRLRIADIPDFPEASYSADVIDFGKNTKAIDKAAKELEEALGALSERKSQDKDPEMVLTKILRARQELEILKAPTWAKMAIDEIEAGRKVVIMVAFNETMDLLKGMLNTDCVIRGGQSPKVREANRVDFVDDRERAIIVNINAGGQALDLHDIHGVYPVTEFLPPDFNARMVQQAAGRVHRDGGKSKALIKFFYAAKTIEVHIADVCQDKLNQIALINDGDIDSVLKVMVKDF